MGHKCIYCGAHLVYEDTCGVGPYWRHDNNPEGEVYQCPNHEGFDTEEAAWEYMTELGGKVMMSEFGWESWEDVVCDSSCHHVSGMFYTDRSGELKEGYPC